jgi:hypothetical protein
LSIVAIDNTVALQLSSTNLNAGNDIITLTGVNQTAYIIGGDGHDHITAPNAYHLVIIGDHADVQKDGVTHIIDGHPTISSPWIVNNRGNDIINVLLSSSYQSSLEHNNVTSTVVVVSGGGNDHITVDGAVTTHICADDCHCKLDYPCHSLF